MGVPFALQTSVSLRTFSLLPILPGLKRTFANPISLQAAASFQSNCISATSGTDTAERIFRQEFTSFSSHTARRTISQPAFCNFFIWFTVASISAVWVLVMDCTGAPPPISILPTLTFLLSFTVRHTSVYRNTNPIISTIITKANSNNKPTE